MWRVIYFLQLSQHIAALEARNIGEKPWQMTGEVGGQSRPQNSLLEEDLLCDLGSRPPPLPTEETTRSLEDIIKQRVIQRFWDDVQRKEKPKEISYKYSVARPLDQEKSKLSLAEVYEQEYMTQLEVSQFCNPPPVQP